MASRDGFITEDISRITGRGWFDFGTSGGGGAHQQFSAVGNQVAAMPSLHAGLSILVATYLITRLRSPWRWLMVLYPVAMSFMLVYYAEHYVIDIIAGGVCVVAVMAGWTTWERRRRRPKTLESRPIPTTYSSADDLEVEPRGPHHAHQPDPDRQQHLGAARRGQVAEVDDIGVTELG